MLRGGRNDDKKNVICCHLAGLPYRGTAPGRIELVFYGGLGEKVLVKRFALKDSSNSGSAGCLELSRGWMLPVTDAYF